MKEDEPKPSSDQHYVVSDKKTEGERPPLTENYPQVINHESESLERQHSGANLPKLHIEETSENPVAPGLPEANGLKNGEVSDSLDHDLNGSACIQKVSCLQDPQQIHTVLIISSNPLTRILVHCRVTVTLSLFELQGDRTTEV